MPQLIVRNLEDAVVRRLKKRAGDHGVSMEEEHRRILREALLGKPDAEVRTFWQQLSAMPDGGGDGLFVHERSLSKRAPEQLFED